MSKFPTVFTALDRAYLKKGCVYIRDIKQARDGQRQTARSFAGYNREDLIFDHEAFAATLKQEGRSMTRIITKNVNPPIPIRTSDWCAYIDGQEENGPYGWGRTKEEAIADLQENLYDY